MQIIDQKAYDDWKANNPDPYGACIFRYAESWAELMEAKLAQGEKLVDIADAMSDKADTAGITGYMYGAAVSVLAKCWAHGESLRRWHNNEVQLGTEGDEANESNGVLNPAVLCMGKKKSAE